jgi:hypothetical protein
LKKMCAHDTAGMMDRIPAVVNPLSGVRRPR